MRFLSEDLELKACTWHWVVLDSNPSSDTCQLCGFQQSTLQVRAPANPPQNGEVNTPQVVGTKAEHLTAMWLFFHHTHPCLWCMLICVFMHLNDVSPMSLKVLWDWRLHLFHSLPDIAWQSTWHIVDTHLKHAEWIFPTRPTPRHFLLK